ncbi:hypothetical protein, partial [Helicobacter vulpis]|uniref:hypothetical protein n=1 Tax=Helicobacter vulpis TaxID=2316076 RepID=UPI0013CE2DE5
SPLKPITERSIEELTENTTLQEYKALIEQAKAEGLLDERRLKDLNELLGLEKHRWMIASRIKGYREQIAQEKELQEIAKAYGGFKGVDYYCYFPPIPQGLKNTLDAFHQGFSADIYKYRSIVLNLESAHPMGAVGGLLQEAQSVKAALTNPDFVLHPNKKPDLLFIKQEGDHFFFV